jgi:hypothetical protein
MSAGFSFTKADLDAKMGSLVVTVRDGLLRCNQMNSLLNNTQIVPNDAFLTGLGYTSGEVTILRAAFADLNSLNNVANAAGTVPSNNNFFFNAQKLTGVVLI